MAVLITGGAGFVGLNLAERLLARGDEVLIFGPNPPPAAALAMLSTLPGRLQLIRGDVTRADDLDAVLGVHPIDRLIHGAAITADLGRERRAARDIFAVNVLGTVEVLEAALRHDKVGRVLQLGTGSIFGAAGLLSDSLDERSSPVFPDSLYGISKFAAERTALRYRSTRGLNVTVVRLGMVFGRWEYDTGVRDTLSLALQLTDLAERGARVVLHADAADDWVYSVDVAQGLLGVLDQASLPEPVYHLSAGLRWSIDAWCQRLQQRFPGFQYAFTDRLDAVSIGRGKVARRSPMNIDRIRRDTGYGPAYLLEQAFDDFLAWRDRARRAGWFQG